MVFSVGQYSAVIYIYHDYSWLPWQQNSRKMDYTSASVSTVFASIGGFSGLGYRMLPMKFCLDPFSLPWQQSLSNLDKTG